MFRKFFESIISESNAERLHSAATNLRNQIEAQAIQAGNYAQYENTAGNVDQRQRLRSTPSREDVLQRTNFLKCLECGHIACVETSAEISESQSNSNACGFCSQRSLQPIISNMDNSRSELPFGETDMSGSKDGVAVTRRRRHVRSASSGVDPKTLLILSPTPNMDVLASSNVREKREQSTSTTDRSGLPVINVMINVNTNRPQNTLVSKSVSIDDDDKQVVNLQVHIQRKRDTTNGHMELNETDRIPSEIDSNQSATTTAADQVDENLQHTWINVIENRRSYTDTREGYIESIVEMFELARDDNFRFRATVLNETADSTSISKSPIARTDCGLLSKVYVLFETIPPQRGSVPFSVPLHVLDEVLDRWPGVCTLFDLSVDEEGGIREPALADWIHKWLKTVLTKIPCESVQKKMNERV